MLIQEVLNKKRDSKTKIKELLKFLLSECSQKPIEEVDIITQALFKEIDAYRNYKIIVEEANKNSFISIDGSKVDICRAVIVRDTIKQKLDVLTHLIENNIGGILGVIDQRDSLINEFESLNILIKKSDLKIEV